MKKFGTKVFVALTTIGLALGSMPLTINAAEPQAAVMIPANAGTFNGHYYYVFNNENYTYEQAKLFCEAVGGYLATITSQEENDYVFQYMKLSGYQSAYFGLSDSATEGTWTWSNGETVNYTNWSKNEPNAERSDEDYAMFYYKYETGKWNDGNFGNGTVRGGKAFICEWNGDATGQVPVATEPVVAQPTTTIPMPVDAGVFNGHHYYIYNGAGYTYELAAQHCIMAGGYLATVTSQEENDYLYQYMKNVGYESAYFGLSDAALEGTWVWSNGELLEYTNWAQDEPNAVSSGEDYGMFYYRNKDGKWNDGDFDSGTTIAGGKAFICEWNYQN